MAASDYCQIMFGNDGKAARENGKFKFLEVLPYKTWLYLESPELWREGGGFSKNTIGQITEGTIALFGVSITVQSVDLVNNEGVPYNKVNLFYCRGGYGADAIRYGGICCYAYLDYERKIAQENGIPDDWDIISSSDSVHPITQEKHPTNGWYQTIEFLPPNQPKFAAPQTEWDEYFKLRKIIIVDDLPEYKDKLGINSYCGITDDMIQAFLNWNVPDKEWLDKVRDSDKTYSNQGNAYFGSKLGFNTTEKVGENKPVLMHELIKKI